MEISFTLAFALFVLLVYAIAGAKQGFMKSFVTIVVIAAALFLANVGHSYVSKFIVDHTELDENLQTKIATQLRINVTEKITSKTEQITAIENLSLPKVLKEKLIENNNQDIYSELSVDGFVDYVTALLSRIVINAIGYLACFVILVIFFAVLASMTNFLADLPIIGWFNSLGGALLGLVQGVLIIWFFFIIITMIITTTFGSAIYAEIQANKYLLYLYEHNLLLELFLNISKMLF